MRKNGEVRPSGFELGSSGQTDKQTDRQTCLLKYRRLRGDKIEVFKIVKNYYDLEAAVGP